MVVSGGVAEAATALRVVLVLYAVSFLSESKEPAINSALGILEIFCLHSACNSQQLSFEMKLHGGSAQHPFSTVSFKARYCFILRCTVSSGTLALRASLGKDIVLRQLFFNLASL